VIELDIATRSGDALAVVVLVILGIATPPLTTTALDFKSAKSGGCA